MAVKAGYVSVSPSQLDPSTEGWRPDRGEDFVGTIKEVQRQVATLIENPMPTFAPGTVRGERGKLDAGFLVYQDDRAVRIGAGEQ